MGFDVTELIIRVPVLLFAITIHEYSHGKAALSLGDPTAKNAGRLTLNPIRHLDPLGTLCLLFFPFGWARPVPVNPLNFKDIKTDTILMSLSGPLSNFAAAFIAGLFLRFLYIPVELYILLLVYMIILNTGLGVFNLLPIPPLDGSHVFENLLPPHASATYRRLGRYAPLVLVGLILMDHYMNIRILSTVLIFPIKFLAGLFGGTNFQAVTGW